MADRPDVAVIVAAHDPGRYLRETLDSVLGQTHHAWECVVIDDGSAQDLRWVGDVDDRIRLVRQANTGTGPARNAGAALTTAPVLGFLDHDDLWRPTYLRRQLELLAVDRAVLASTGFDVVDASSAVVGPGFVGHNRSYADLLGGCGLFCGAVVVRRAAFERAGGFRPYPVSQDWDLWLRILRDGGAAARTDDVLASWRRHDGNASADYRALWHDGRRLLAEHDHPVARAGRRHVRRLSGVQAYDAARAAHSTHTRAHHLAWAVTHAPGYTLGALAGRARGRRTERAG